MQNIASESVNIRRMDSLGKGVGVVAVIISLAMMTACSKQSTSTDNSAKAKQSQTTNPNAPKPKHSKIAVPAAFPQDIPLPHNIQLEKYHEVIEDAAATLEGLLAGNVQSLMDGIHAQMLKSGWKANLVIPQGKQVLMHYTKDKRNVIIELNTSVDDVVSYSLSYGLNDASPPASAKANTEKSPTAPAS